MELRHGRYGALAVVTIVSAALGLFAVALVPLYVSKRRRDRRRLEALRVADAALEEAARASALQALLDSGERPSGNEPLPVSAEARYPAG